MLLRRIIRDEGLLRYSDYHTGDGRAFYDAVAELGLEGVVAKRLQSHYQAGRAGGWLKIKCPRVERFVIGGWTEPGGSRTHFGALLVGQYEAPGVLRFVGRAGTGFDDEALRTIATKLRERTIDASPFRRRGAGEPAIPAGAHFCAPELVCNVRFTEWTEGGVVRNPSFLGLVADADPAACVYQGPGASMAEAVDDFDGTGSSPLLVQGEVAAKPRERRESSEFEGLNRESPQSSPSTRRRGKSCRGSLRLRRPPYTIRIASTSRTPTKSSGRPKAIPRAI
jgi:bifunctional non-homologous end joining protein LigD